VTVSFSQRAPLHGVSYIFIVLVSFSSNTVLLPTWLLESERSTLSPESDCVSQNFQLCLLFILSVRQWKEDGIGGNFLSGEAK
jgi:hypothetical protein